MVKSPSHEQIRDRIPVKQSRKFGAGRWVCAKLAIGDDSWHLASHPRAPLKEPCLPVFHARLHIRVSHQPGQRCIVRDRPRSQLHMPHELAGTLQQARRIRKPCPLKEPHIYVRGEHIHVAEGCVSQTRNRTAVMQKLPDFVPAISHHLKPSTRNRSQLTGMLSHPRFNRGIPLHSAIESQQIRRLHRF